LISLGGGHYKGDSPKSQNIKKKGHDKKMVLQKKSGQRKILAAEMHIKKDREKAPGGRAKVTRNLRGGGGLDSKAENSHHLWVVK